MTDSFKFEWIVCLPALLASLQDSSPIYIQVLSPFLLSSLVVFLFSPSGMLNCGWRNNIRKRKENRVIRGEGAVPHGPDRSNTGEVSIISPQRDAIPIARLPNISSIYDRYRSFIYIYLVIVL